MDADAEYCVFVVPGPVDEAKRPVDAEMDETARRLLHERVDALDEDRLIACASAAADGGTAPPDDGEPAVWCRQHLHDAVDGVLGRYDRYCATLYLDNESVVITGDGVEFLPKDETYAWMAALAESRITDEPLAGAGFALETLTSSVSVDAVATWFARHLLRGLAEAGVDSESAPAEEVLGSFLDYEALDSIAEILARGELP